MLQLLCLQVCMYGGSPVPQGGVGDRHLATVPWGVVGDRLPWAGEGHGGGGGLPMQDEPIVEPRLNFCLHFPS